VERTPHFEAQERIGDSEDHTTSQRGAAQPKQADADKPEEDWWKQHVHLPTPRQYGWIHCKEKCAYSQQRVQ
jgi:hypothetical protein